jgi:hypothetical protein
MANEKAVLFIGANRPVRGREPEAKAFWMEAGAWLDAQSKLGFFSRWDAFWLTAHGGDLNNAFVCYGERERLDEWRRTDAFEAWVFRASSCLDGLGIVPGVSFAAAQDTLARRQQAVGDK